MNQNGTLISHNTMLNNHDPMINDNIDLLVNHTQTIIAQNNTINLQQVHIDNLEIQLALVGGYLVNLDITLGQEFPAELDLKALKEVVNENQRLDDEIVRLDANIAETQIQLEQAEIDGNKQKINKFKATIGSDQVSRAIAQAKLNMTFLYIEYYELIQ